MPIYEYHCIDCGHHFESMQCFKDEALVDCPVCGEATLKKLISAPAFHLKGTGWYVTDFKDKPKPDGNKGEKPTEKALDENEKVKKEPVLEAKPIESKDVKSTTTKKADKSDSQA